MKFLVFIVVFFLLPLTGNVPSALAQTAEAPTSVAYEEKLSSLLSFSVPMITIEDYKTMNNAVLLDARAEEEYQISHIPSAQHIGYDQINESILENLDKNTPIVLYCSVGYRSEKVGEKLINRGFTKVYNLYGSIFEWVNRNNTIVTPAGQPTKKIHTYNRSWSQWMTNATFEKVW